MGLFGKKKKASDGPPPVAALLLATPGQVWHLPQPTGQPEAAQSGRISLSKGQRVSITKSATVIASCSWPPATDYDVFAIVRFADGHTETVSQFGTMEGNNSFVPQTSDGAVRHTGDVGRSGGGQAIESIEITLNPAIVAVLPVVYSAQSNGEGSFRQYQVSMAIDNGQGSRVEISSANASDDEFVFSCVPGLIVNGANGIEIHATELYSASGSESRPVLGSDLSITMDAGETNYFK